MSGSLRRFLRDIAPHGIVERRRAALYASDLRRYGIEGDAARIVECAEACRFDLWPESLRRRATGWTLVDVGANQGEFLEAVRYLVAPGKVFAVEPLAECQQQLRERVARYSAGEVFPVILDEEPGTKDIVRTQNSKFSSVLEPVGRISKEYAASDSNVLERISVRSETLDRLLANVAGDIGLLKIDVQGFEAPVLRGAQETLLRTTAVLVEINYVRHYEGATGYREVFEILHAAGFELRGVSCPYRGPSAPLWADALFARAGTA